MEEWAYAKVNLSLKVIGRRPDGYHELETLFAFAEHGDVLSVAEGEGLTLDVTGPFAAGVPRGIDNLVLRAAALLGQAPRRGAAMTLDKRLPVAAGIGGGSADAAAALRLLNRFWGLDLDLRVLAERARGLGADVPACVLSRTILGTGRGEHLTEVEEDYAGTPLLLVNPGVSLSTAEVFRAWDGASGGDNHLLAPALRLVPEIGEVLEALASAPRSGMSGSGATCFALFDAERERDRLAASLPARWWRLASRLR